MKCHVCGAMMRLSATDLPFKVRHGTIVIFKDLPVLQCDNCSECLLEDAVMSRVEEMLDRVDVAAEIEVIRYAA